MRKWEQDWDAWYGSPFPRIFEEKDQEEFLSSTKEGTSCHSPRRGECPRCSRSARAACVATLPVSRSGGGDQEGQPVLQSWPRTPSSPPEKKSRWLVRTTSTPSQTRASCPRGATGVGERTRVPLEKGSQVTENHNKETAGTTGPVDPTGRRSARPPGLFRPLSLFSSPL